MFSVICSKERPIVKSTKPGFNLFALSMGAVLLLSIGGCGGSTTESSAPTVSPETAGSIAPAASMAQKININKAPITELDKLELPGTKPSLSERIQGARPYKTTEDLVAKKAISQDELKLIQNLITVGESK
jgi:DNA uptake protein ComE-like DNA-binding protein